MNTNPKNRLRPMATATGTRQHMAQPATLDGGQTWTWVALCGVPVSAGRTVALLRKNREHTGLGDCNICAVAMRSNAISSPLAPNAKSLLDALR